MLLTTRHNVLHTTATCLKEALHDPEVWSTIDWRGLSRFVVYFQAMIVRTAMHTSAAHREENDVKTWFGGQSATQSKLIQPTFLPVRIFPPLFQSDISFFFPFQGDIIFSLLFQIDNNFSLSLSL